jgi:Ca2+-binding RTX toxin-like protein
MREGNEIMVRRVTLMLTLAAITAVVVLTVKVSGAPAVAGGPIYCVSGKVCKGDSGDNLIIGSQGNDDINPFGGDDTVYASGGDDSVRHSYGNDTLWGGTGSDTLRGGFGHDTIYGNQPSTTDPKADVGDSAHDLIDCAYLDSRGDPGPDVGYGELTDTVVDCSNRDL